MHTKEIDNTPKTTSSTMMEEQSTKQSTVAGGEDYDYVEKEIDEELICSICLLPFIDPISHISCGNTFCSKCVERVANCPKCGEGEFKKTSAPSAKMIRNLLDKLKVKCGMCKNIVLRGELKDHQEKYCPLHEAYQQVEEFKKKLDEEFQQRVQKLENEHQETKSKLEQEFQSKLNKLETEHQELLKSVQEEKNQYLRQSKETTVKLEEHLLQEFKQKQEVLESNLRDHEREHKELLKTVQNEREQYARESKETLTKLEQTLVQEFNEKQELLKIKIEECESSILTREKLEMSNKPIHLNVRGTIITVSLGTFIHNEREPDNLFKKMFTGQHPCYQTSSKKFNDPIYFIDCDPIIFKLLLEWLQFGNVVNELSGDMKQSLSSFSKLFNLINLEKEVKSINLIKLTQLELINLLNSANTKLLSLSGIDFRCLALRNVNLSGIEIIGSNFSGVDLFGTNFSGAICKECNFNNCYLIRTNFSKCELRDCKFRNAIMKETNYSKTAFINCEFVDIEISRVDLSNCIDTEIIIYSITESDVSNCKIRLRNIRKNQEVVSKCNFSGCDLSSHDFSCLLFIQCDLTNTIISGSIFHDATFQNCQIQTKYDNSNNLENCKFISCDFNGSIFEQINFKLQETNQFNNCTFKNLELKELKDLSKFNGSTFDSCLFNFEQFTNKHIQNIQFQNIDLQKQDLSYFSCTNIKFTNTSFVNVKINPKYFGLSTSIINNCDTSISCELYSHTKSKSIPQLLYRGSRDGFKVKEFHSKCDNQGPTLTIIKSEHNQIFGAFTSQSWQSPQSERYVSDSSAFVFKICQDSTNQNYQFKKFNIKQEREKYAIRLDKDYLPIFGDGYDICIKSDCNLYNNSFSNFGETYELPKGYKYEINEAKSYLAGSRYFKVCEIEVFKINQ